HRRVEVAESYLRELFAEQLHELFHAQALAGLGYAQFSEIPVRIDIEIPPLDHGEISGADELAERFIFLDAIGHSRENKIIDGCPAAETADDAQTFDDIVEGIVIRTVIGIING